VRDGNDITYDVNELTNRYASVGGSALEYDAAGNTKDRLGYEYEYDYENRIVKVTKDNNDIAEFAYDALGRRIRKTDCVADTNTLYYYNDSRQVLCEYSTAALVDAAGAPQERYEYDAYGQVHILDANFADGASDCGNPYMFQGKRLDLLDNGGLELMSWPYRDYSMYLGRWHQAEKLGMIPNDRKYNLFDPRIQYSENLNLYQFACDNPVVGTDPYGLGFIEPGFSDDEALDVIDTIAASAAKQRLLQICDEYTCYECCMQGVRYRKDDKQRCRNEALLLWNRYDNRFTAWANEHPGYHECFVLAQETFKMNLDVGLKWFDLKRMQTGSLGHVGVFRRCNRDYGATQGGYAKSDKRLDPWLHPSWFIITFWVPLTPDVRAGLYGWIRKD